MNDLRDLLDARVREVKPRADALERVVLRVERRKRRRRATAGTVGALVVIVTLGAIAGRIIGSMDSRVRPATAALAASPDSTVAPDAAWALRTRLGIEGATKGASGGIPTRVLARRLAPSVLQFEMLKKGSTTSGGHANGPGHGTSGAGAAGDSTTHPRVVVVFTSQSGEPTSLVPARGRRGVRTKLRPRTILIPRLAGGPSFLSVSPLGDVAVLFGVTSEPRTGRRVPHLFVGRFDGQSVSRVRRLRAPAGAVQGPLGWIGNNAFLLSAGPARGEIVRIDGERIRVAAAGIPDPCAAPAEPSTCAHDGPRLLGTNEDGSLLFWLVRLSDTPKASLLAASYYSTWLDGTHTLLLTGTDQRYGPPLAAR